MICRDLDNWFTASQDLIADFIATLKIISDLSPNGIGFLAVFGHGSVETDAKLSTNGEPMIFANDHYYPGSANIYTSDLAKI